jgi:MerR family copper efflux transcriptional regulator
MTLKGANMNISQAAEACGLPVKTLRYYETLGLVVPGRQAGNDYREYTLENIEHLRFLQRGRAAGFSLEECRQLLQFYLEGIGNDAACREWMQKRIDSLDAQMLALTDMHQTLVKLLADSQEAGVLQFGRGLQGGMSFLLVDNNE